MGKGSGCGSRPAMSFAGSNSTTFQQHIPTEFHLEAKNIISKAKIQMKEYELKPEVIWLSGSIAYGTHHTNSDVDIRGLYCERLENLQSIFIPSRNKGLSEWQPVIDEVFETDDDLIFFENKKMLKLCTAGSNVSIEFLFSPQLETSQVGDILSKYRSLLINQRIKHCFLGMAAKSYKKLEALDEKTIEDKKDIKFVTHSYRVHDNLQQLLQTGEMDIKMRNVEEIKEKVTQWPAHKIIADLRQQENKLESMKTSLPEKSNLAKVNKLSQEMYLASWNM